MVLKSDGSMALINKVGIFENENNKLSTGIYTFMYLNDHSLNKPSHCAR